MDSKKLFAIAAASVFLALVGAYLVDGYAPTDSVRTEPADGDVIEYTYTEHSGSASVVWIHSMTVLNYNTDGTLAVANQVKDEIFPTGMSTESYLSKAVPEIPADLTERTGTEKIETPFGNRECDVLVYDGEGFTLKLWVGTGSGVLYHTEERTDGAPDDVYMECWLTECTLLYR